MKNYEFPHDLPELPASWEWYALGNLIDRSRGISYGVVQPGQDDPEGVPIIRVNNIKAGRFLLDDVKRIAPEIEKAYGRTRLRGGEVLITLVGTIGECLVVPDELANWNLARAVGVIPVQETINPYWVTYSLRWSAIQHLMMTWANTTVQTTLNLADVARLPIPMPPDAERQTIVGILKSLDDKIDLNRRMNAALEATARALFQSWFVDFDPVRAKAEGRAPEGMDAATAALFPDSFEDSALGLIPSGWRVGRLDELLVLQRGFDLPSDQRIPGDYPIIAASGPSGTHNEYRVKGPGVTTGRSGVLGNVYFVHEDYWPLNTSLWVKEFRISAPHHAYFALGKLDFSLLNAGSAVPTLNRNHVHDLPVVVPTAEIVKQFENMVSPLFALEHQCSLESHTLAETRDALLPRLISGALRVDGI